jgi:hypothetical protein
MSDGASSVSLSYSRIDSEFALKLARDLRSAGTDIWIDQLDIAPGEPLGSGDPARSRELSRSAAHSFS